MRQHKADRVFQPDYAQPKMLICDHDKLEYELMCKKCEEQKKAQEIEDKVNEMLTEEEKVDIQTMKDRNWDDWKDEHEKGAGNRNK